MKPTYDYKCASCHHIREVKHGINETPIVDCDNCGKAMEKIITKAPQVNYKGDWYKTKQQY